jgi:hypothetical protein
MDEIYKSGVVRCWKCGKNTKVWSWPGHKLWPEELPTPEMERPGNLKWMYSSTIHDSYWASSCENCGFIQGDWYLFVGPDRVFEGEAVLGLMESVMQAGYFEEPKYRKSRKNSAWCKS